MNMNIRRNKNVQIDGAIKKEAYSDRWEKVDDIKTLKNGLVVVYNDIPPILNDYLNKNIDVCVVNPTHETQRFLFTSWNDDDFKIAAGLIQGAAYNRTIGLHYILVGNSIVNSNGGYDRIMGSFSELFHACCGSIPNTIYSLDPQFKVPIRDGGLKSPTSALPPKKKKKVSEN